MSPISSWAAARDAQGPPDAIMADGQRPSSERPQVALEVSAVTEPGRLARGRELTDEEVAEVLALDVPAHLATMDPDGYPRITPIWFVWDGDAFRMTSLEGRPHLSNLARDPRAAICVDTEDPHPIGGVRADRQVKAQAIAQLSPDEGGEWTRRITLKYVPGGEGEAAAERRVALPRVLVTLRPERLVRIGTASRQGL